MKVVLNKNILQNFRKRAWTAFPKEHIEALLGRVEGDTVYVHVIFHMVHRADVWACYFEEDELAHIREEAQALGLQLVGTIHSHTGQKTCEHMSRQDHHHGLKEQETVMGVLFMYKHEGKRRSRVNFYIPTEPVKLEFSRL